MVIWFGSLEFMSTGFGYDMILHSIKGPGGVRIMPPRLPAQEEVWTASPPPLCRFTVIDSYEADGGAGADSPTC